MTGGRQTGMKRFHAHLAVHDLEQSIRFYKAMFDAGPTVLRDDYAKWQLQDPRVTFAISTRGARTGVDRFGIQAENGTRLQVGEGKTACLVPA